MTEADVPRSGQIDRDDGLRPVLMAVVFDPARSAAQHGRRRGAIADPAT